jgi:hypothetical protein
MAKSLGVCALCIVSAAVGAAEPEVVVEGGDGTTQAVSSNGRTKTMTGPGTTAIEGC